MGQLQEDLGEERCSGDRMMERLDKTKAQAGFLPLTGAFLSCIKFHSGVVSLYKFSQLF